MDFAQFDGCVRPGPEVAISIADAARQLESITRYVARSREELAESERDGDSPALDADKALAFAHEARSVSLTDAEGETVAVVVSPAVLEVLEDALGLLQGELDRARGTEAGVSTEELRDQLKGRMRS